MRLLPLVLCALIAASTGCSPSPEGEVSVDEGEPLYFETLSSGQTAATRDTIETIVRTPDAWNQISGQFRPVRPIPDVDFTQTMIGIISVPTTSGGYSIQVESAEVVDSTLVVDYVMNVPGSSCITVQALAEPFQIVRIRQKAVSDSEFVRRIEHYSCALE